MIDVVKSLGIQSWTLRGSKTNAEVIVKVKECGLAAIELCPAHVNLKDPASFDGVIKLYRDAGVKITSIGVMSFAGDEAAERNYFEFARKAGFKFIMAEEYDVRLGIHNHGGRHWLGCSQMLSEVFAKSSPRIGLCLDTAWALDSGEDPVKMAETFGKRLYGVHIKDFVFDRAGKPQDVVVGTGNLNLPALYQAMKKFDFSGCAILEYEGDTNNPVPTVRQCVEAVRKQMKG